VPALFPITAKGALDLSVIDVAKEKPRPVIPASSPTGCHHSSFSEKAISTFTS
jgi:hypothetical protein